MTDKHKIKLTVNGTVYEREIDPRMSLGDFLRDELSIASIHFGCEHGVCGACTIHLNGESVRSCLTLAVQANNAEVMTVEGIGDIDNLHPLQEAFRDHHALQCGYCTPGMIMTALDLKEKHPLTNEAEVREALSGNICRCTGYQNIVSAVLEWAAHK